MARLEDPKSGQLDAELISAVAAIANVDVVDVRLSSRLLEDLNLDSFALLEVVTFMLVDLGFSGVPQALEAGGWADVTIEAMRQEFVNAGRSGWVVQSQSTTPASE